MNINLFQEKLKEWYGNSLYNKQVEVLHVDQENEEVYAVIFMLKENENVEITRVFPIGGKMEISIDCQADLTTLDGIRKLIQYGGSFKQFEIEDLVLI